MIVPQRTNSFTLCEEAVRSLGEKIVMLTPIFKKQGPMCAAVTVLHDLYRLIEKTSVLTVFELLEIKVPIEFLGPGGFSRHRERRYSERDTAPAPSCLELY